MSKRDEIIRALQNDARIRRDGLCKGQFYPSAIIEKLIDDGIVTVYLDGDEEYIRLRK